MDGLFENASSVKSTLAASYHLVQIDIDNNMPLLGKYDSSGNFALPVLLVISPSGTLRVDTNKTGNPEFSESGFNAFLTKWAQ